MLMKRITSLWLAILGMGLVSDGWSAPALTPMRPLPMAMQGPLTAGPKYFVDAAKGDDSHTGSEAAPWKTLGHALHQLKPGDTLYLRGGVYYESPLPTRSGTKDAPITVSSYPGELAIIDGGLREFAESPETCWEPLKDGAEGEYVSTKTYAHVDTRRVPTQFVPANWEPMSGLEDERPLALGDFEDSMIPLHGYRTLADLRSKNEFWTGSHEKSGGGFYCGPGVWFNRDTGRIHIRLAHTELEGLGDKAYRGETNPRKLRLVIALGFGDEVMRLTGVNHLRFQGLVFRGATGSPMISIYSADDIGFDHVTVFGGFPGLLLNAARDIHVTNSAFRSLAAPWTSRAHMKYRGTASYAILLRNDQPMNENIEFGFCEFTDGHDFAFLRYAKNLQFHHNFVDNFNDDGLEFGPKLRSHSIFIYENRIGAILSPFTQHDDEKDASPIEHDPNSGMFVYRNVIDLRNGTYKAPPRQPDAPGAFLHEEGHLASDHGSPIWPVMRFYQNAVLRETPVFRDHFLFGLGTGGLKNTERDVFNNLFVQMNKVPGASFSGIREIGPIREGGNILWGVKDGPAITGDPFAKFRASAIFATSRKFYEPGLSTQDRVADPKFVHVPDDLRPQAGSAAVGSGQPLPAEWPDPLRPSDAKAPDIGALPLGAQPWGVGIDGRIPLFGTSLPATASNP
jgi:hypothetical protein